MANRSYAVLTRLGRIERSHRSQKAGSSNLPVMRDGVSIHNCDLIAAADYAFNNDGSV